MKIRRTLIASALLVLIMTATHASPVTMAKTVVKKAITNTCVIKGNINKKEKIYHLPGCASYNATKIDQPGEKYFCSEKDAKTAGFRKALNCPR